jgi:exodeoxyribonuclease VII large subunit
MTNDNTAINKKIYSVSELTRGISLLLEDSFKNIWVQGEVSNFILHTSGHCYFSLKDQDSVIACVIFKHSAAKLKFRIESGMSIICSGRIGVYGKRGQYQLYIDKAEPKGIGALQIAFTQLKEKLYKEGLFDDAHKKPIPKFPDVIGVVTSPTGAAIRDILNIINRRFENTHIVLFPAKVQGEGASVEITDGIEALNRHKDIDVIIVTRGGGSLEDLWAFNEECVARAIYSSNIPVISAVGHEIDYTIADFVSDLRAPTPSAAAELVVRKKSDIISDIETFKSRLKQSLGNHVSIAQRHLEGIMKRYAFKQPLFLIEQYQQSLDETAKSLSQALNFFLMSKHQSLQAIQGKMDALSPVAILKRGYSITMVMPGLGIIKDSAQAKIGTQIKTRLAKGELISRVEKSHCENVIAGDVSAPNIET